MTNAVRINTPVGDLNRLVLSIENRRRSSGDRLLDQVWLRDLLAEERARVPFTDRAAFDTRADRVLAALDPAPPTDGPTLTAGSLTVDPSTRNVTIDGVRVLPLLSRKEFALLTILAADPGRAFSKEELVRRVWPYSADGTAYVRTLEVRTLDSHMCRLRRKLGSGWIINVWGFGYRLLDPAPVEVVA